MINKMYYTIMDDCGEYTDDCGVYSIKGVYTYHSRKRYDDGKILLATTKEMAEKWKDALEKDIHKVGLIRKFEIVEIEI
jgi:hypothetical protein